MIELIFVITILGVVASISSSIIVQTYESYIMQRAIHNASLKTELAINQLGNRLAYRLQRSLVARVPGQSGFGTNNALPLNQIGPTTPNRNQYTALEWIGYDNDSFSAQRVPGWSGFCDLNATTTTTTTITTTGSRLLNTSGTDVSANTILSNIYGNSSPALYFLGRTEFATGQDYTTACMYDTTGNNCLFPVTFNSDTTISFDGNNLRTSNLGNLIYTELYQITASAFAVVPENGRDSDGDGTNDLWDLYLYSNYQPWQGESYNTTGQNISKSKLAVNVSVFRFKQENGSLRIKICSREQIGDANASISICKEKAVIR